MTTFQRKERCKTRSDIGHQGQQPPQHMMAISIRVVRLIVAMVALVSFVTNIQTMQTTMMMVEKEDFRYNATKVVESYEKKDREDEDWRDDSKRPLFQARRILQETPPIRGSSVTTTSSSRVVPSLSSSSSPTSATRKLLQSTQQPQPESIATKFFGIGLKKTGTSTLDSIFQKLSKRHQNDRQNTDVFPGYGTMSSRNDTSRAFSLADKYTYFQDVPWFVSDLYPILADQYPTAKFILTTRDPEQWWSSVDRWVHCSTTARIKRRQKTGTQKLEWYRELFNAKSISKEDMIEAFLDHNAAVRKFFAATPDRLLEIDLTSPTTTMSKLCSFMGVATHHCPKGDIPHSNKTPTTCSS